MPQRGSTADDASVERTSAERARRYHWPHMERGVRRPAFVVELVGARGVGKSTVAAAIELELRARGIAPDATPPRRPLQRLENRIRSTLMAWASRRSFLRWRPESAAELRKLVRRYRSLCDAMAEADQHGGVHVIDEGLCHLALTAYVKTRNKDMEALYAALRRRVRAPDMVVHVVGSEDVVAERRRLRSKPGDRRTPRLNAEGRQALRAFERLLESLQASSAGLAYVTLRNDDPDVRRAAAQIVERVAHTLGPETAAGHAADHGTGRTRPRR